MNGFNHYINERLPCIYEQYQGILKKEKKTFSEVKKANLTTFFSQIKLCLKKFC